MRVKVINKEKLKRLFYFSPMYAKRVRNYVFYDGLWQIYVKSESREDLTHEVLINFDKLLFMCDCEDWNFQNNEEPDLIINTKKIWFCKHIVGSLEFLKYYTWQARELWNTIEYELNK